MDSFSIYQYLVYFSHRLVFCGKLIDGHTVRLQLRHNLPLEPAQLGLVDRVRLANHRDDVHLLVQLLHADQVDRLESVAGGTDKVEADMDAAVVIHGQIPLDLELLLQVGLELAVNVVDDGAEAVLLVDLVAVADGVDERKLEVDVALLELVGVGLEADALLLVALWCRVKTSTGWVNKLNKKLISTSLKSSIEVIKIETRMKTFFFMGDTQNEKINLKIKLNRSLQKFTF